MNTILYEEKESMHRDYVNGKSPYFLQVDIQKEISSYGVEQKMNDYIGMQKAILPILEQEGFFKEVINEETEINGLGVRIRMVVKKTSAKNKFWLHMIDINEKNPITQS